MRDLADAIASPIDRIPGQLDAGLQVLPRPFARIAQRLRLGTGLALLRAQCGDLLVIRLARANLGVLRLGLQGVDLGVPLVQQGMHLANEFVTGAHRLLPIYFALAKPP